MCWNLVFQMGKTEELTRLGQYSGLQMRIKMNTKNSAKSAIPIVIQSGGSNERVAPVARLVKDLRKSWKLFGAKNRHFIIWPIRCSVKATNTRDVIDSLKKHLNENDAEKGQINLLIIRMKS